MTGTEDFTPEETTALAEMQEAVTTTGPGPAPEPEIAPAAEPASGPERGPDGKFRGKASEAAADAPAPAAEAQEPAKPEGVKPPEGFVPHGAMHQERERAKAAEARAAQLEARLAEIEAAKAQQPAPQPEPWPDPITDPEGHNARLARELAARDQRLEAMQRQALEAQQRQAVISAIASHSQQFAAQTPDYADAINHAVETAKAELMYWNPGISEDQAMAKINADVEAIAAQALRTGRNVAEALYQVAKWRGYQGKPPAAPQPAPAAVDAGRKVEALAAAQRNTESLGAAPVAAGANELTAEGLAKLDEMQLARLYRERPRDVARALGA